MNNPNRQIQAQSSGMNLGEIYYILFRHKWKILAVWGVGIIAAVVLWTTWSSPYQSEARLFIRYVLENRALSAVDDDASIKSPDSRGDAIINSELQILTSFDLLVQVAEAVGPEKILAMVDGGRDPNQAAGVIRQGLAVDVPQKSTVVRIVFQHPDREVVQPVLAQLIDKYLTKHAEIHRSRGALNDSLMQQTDQFRTQLEQAEEALRLAKAKAGVLSVAEDRKSYAEQVSKKRDELFAAEAELAAHRAMLSAMTNVAPASAQVISPEQAAEVPAEEKAEYERVVAFLADLEKSERDLRLGGFTSENRYVQTVREQLIENQKVKAQLETEYPQLLADAGVSVGSPVRVAGAVSPLDLVRELGMVHGLESRIVVLNRQLADIGTNSATLEAAAQGIADLQRKRDLQETNYLYLSANLERARIDEALGPGRISNISRIQEPTPAHIDSGLIKKIAGAAFFGALAVGIALAFIFELYFDRSFKRRADIEKTLTMPFFLSIPRISGHNSGVTSDRRLLAAGSGANGNGSPEKAGVQLPALAVRDEKGLHPYFEALRDRLITYFEVHDMTHKPKLVALTGCAPGAGVSTTAAGLAASLSETGDGNVLLVDMNVENGATHHFHNGKLACSLDEALESGTRGNALVKENLYVVSENGGNGELPRMLPKRFSSLIPRLKASDYDYIIFDMPPVSQISPTPRLARFMDMVLLVVESEKTHREAVRRTAAVLAESQANVGLVLNKYRAYVPERLQQEL